LYVPQANYSDEGRESSRYFEKDGVKSERRRKGEG